MKRTSSAGPRQLGPYDLVSELGRGAMGVVWRARHRPTGAERAVKVIEMDERDPELALRFEREAATLARVGGHAHIVRVHDAGVEGRHAFYAMDLIEGKPLHTLFASGPMEARAACTLMAKIADAVAQCHAHGIVHRDLKPGNILIDGDGEPRLVDFGLVRDLLARRLTVSGMLLGTPAYMSPEQVLGQPAGEPSDVHALGLLVYEALAGSRPYAGKTVNEIVQAVVDHRFAPLEEKRPDLPVALVELVRRALEAKSEARPTAREVARGLERVAKALGRKRLVPAGEVRRYRRVAITLAALVLLLVVLVIFALLGRGRGRAERLAHARELKELARSVLGKDDGLAVAASTSALALDPADRDELLVLRAKARLGLRDVDGVLGDLRDTASPGVAPLRAGALLVGQRWGDLRGLEGSDPFVAAARAVAGLEEGLASAPATKAGELVEQARRGIRGFPELEPVIHELRARAEIASVASRIGATGWLIPDEFTVEADRDREPDGIFKSLAHATDELGEVLKRPRSRYVDPAKDLDSIGLALTVLAADPYQMRTAPGDTEATLEAKRDGVQDLARKLGELARESATREIDALPDRVFCFLVVQRLWRAVDPESRAYLEEHAADGKGLVGSYLRIGILEAVLGDVRAGRVRASQAVAEFEKYLGDVDERLLLPNRKLGHRALLEETMADLAVRAIGEDRDAPRWLAVAALHQERGHTLVERAGQRIQRDERMGHAVLSVAAEVALARGDLEAAERPLRELGRADSRDYAAIMFRAEVERRRGDLSGAERTLDEAERLPDDIALMGPEQRWLEVEWRLARDLVKLARGDAHARERLGDLRARIGGRFPLLPWIEEELRRVLGE